MWLCPVCNTPCESQLCSVCGFDPSTHYEQFPTLTALSDFHKAVSAARTAFESSLKIPSCPVCGKNSDTLLCSHCGFDNSGNFEEYLTLEPIRQIMPSLSRRKQEFHPHYRSRLTCRKCGGTSFAWKFDQTSIGWTCAACDHPLPPDEISMQADTYRYTRIRSLSNPQRFLAAGSKHCAVLHLDGTVIAFGTDKYNQCRTGSWKNIVSVAAGARHTVGLRIDGTVVATGSNGDHQCDVRGWSGIVAIAAGNRHTVGLRSDGTVLTTGLVGSDPSTLETITNAVSIFAGHNMYGALLADGTARIVCKDRSRKVWLSEWNKIKSICYTEQFVAVLDDTRKIRLRAPENHFSLSTAQWIDIVSISAGNSHIVGLHSNGSVAAKINSNAMADLHSWRGILAIAAGDNYTIGLKNDGTILASGTIPLPTNLSIFR